MGKTGAQFENAEVASQDLQVVHGNRWPEITVAEDVGKCSWYGSGIWISIATPDTFIGIS